MLVGVPASGKTHVCSMLVDKFEHIPHDNYMKPKGAYVDAILEKAPEATKPLLIEAPFSVSETVEPLECAGYQVKQIFIIEPHEVVADRYARREGKPIPKGHLTRMNTYAERARAFGEFYGTSSEVLEYLKHVSFG